MLELEGINVVLCAHKSAAVTETVKGVCQCASIMYFRASSLQFIHGLKCVKTFGQYSKHLVAMVMQFGRWVRVVSYIKHCCTCRCWQYSHQVWQESFLATGLAP